LSFATNNNVVFMNLLIDMLNRK